MSVGDWLLGGAAVFGSLGGLAALIKALYDRRAGISGNERQARRDAAEDRRDTIADRDGLISRMEARLMAVEARLTAAEDGNVAKALIIRAAGDHIDVLEHHIYQGKPPPPPPRPPGV